LAGFAAGFVAGRPVARTAGFADGFFTDPVTGSDFDTGRASVVFEGVAAGSDFASAAEPGFGAVTRGLFGVEFLSAGSGVEETDRMAFVDATPAVSDFDLPSESAERIGPGFTTDSVD
jgi:hypothetical protein